MPVGSWARGLVGFFSHSNDMSRPDAMAGCWLPRRQRMLCSTPAATIGSQVVVSKNFPCQKRCCPLSPGLGWRVRKMGRILLLIVTLSILVDPGSRIVVLIAYIIHGRGRVRKSLLGKHEKVW